MSKRPKDMTPDEIAALPKGPLLQKKRPITEEDIKKGRAGQYIVEYVVAKTLPTFPKPDDIMFHTDQRGRSWTFGQFDDGSWYKSPM